MKRTTTALLILGLCTAGLAGCAANGTAPTDKDPAATAKAEGAAHPHGDDVMSGCPGKEAHGDSCGGEAKSDTCGGEAAAKPAAAKDHFGADFSLAAAEPLSAAAAGLEEGAKTLQVSGTVDSVCQKAGCWMVLRDGDVTARIFMKGHSFFLPRDIAGRKALVEGEMKTKTLTEDFAKHLEQDKGGDPASVKGDQREIVMEATGVKLVS